MAGKEEREEKKEIACFLCQKSEHQGVLLPCRKGGQGALGLHPMPAHADPWWLKHILPRFMGRPVYSHHLGNLQVWIANITLIGFSISWILEASWGGVWHPPPIVFGVGQAVAISLFIINLWKSMIPQTSQ